MSPTFITVPKCCAIQILIFPSTNPRRCPIIPSIPPGAAETAEVRGSLLGRSRGFRCVDHGAASWCSAGASHVVRQSGWWNSHMAIENPPFFRWLSQLLSSMFDYQRALGFVKQTVLGGIAMILSVSTIAMLNCEKVYCWRSKCGMNKSVFLIGHQVRCFTAGFIRDCESINHQPTTSSRIGLIADYNINSSWIAHCIYI